MDNSRSSTNKLTVSALLISAGIILPVVFHLIGLGKNFLPMHIPVIIGGFMLDWSHGLLIGLITPLLSALFTGMPPFSPPIAIAMMLELAITGAFSGLFYRLFPGNIYIAMVTALLSGRMVWGIIGFLMLPLIGIKGVPLLYPLGSGLISSLPGIILQIVTIPFILRAINKKDRN